LAQHAFFKGTLLLIRNLIKTLSKMITMLNVRILKMDVETTCN